MTVRVLLFAVARDLAGASERHLSLADGATVSDVVAKLREELPAIAPLLETSAVAVNRVFARSTTLLSEADEVAILPPVSGG